MAARFLQGHLIQIGMLFPVKVQIGRKRRVLNVHSNDKDQRVVCAFHVIDICAKTPPRQWGKNRISNAPVPHLLLQMKFLLFGQKHFVSSEYLFFNGDYDPL